MPRERKLPPGMWDRNGTYYARFRRYGELIVKRLSKDFKTACLLLNELQVRADRGLLSTEQDSLTTMAPERLEVSPIELEEFERPFMSVHANVVYTLWNRESGLLKIGTTGDTISGRIDALTRLAPIRLTYRFVAAEKGDTTQERLLHARFADWRAWPDREWFYPGGPVVAYVLKVQAAMERWWKTRPDIQEARESIEALGKSFRVHKPGEEL